MLVVQIEDPWHRFDQAAGKALFVFRDRLGQTLGQLDLYALHPRHSTELASFRLQILGDCGARFKMPGRSPFSA